MENFEMNEVVDTNVVETPVENVEVVDLATNSNRDALTFGIGAAAGALVTVAVTTAPKVVKWAKGKVADIKRKRAITKQFKEAVNAALNNGNEVEVYEMEPEEDEEEYEE